MPKKNVTFTGDVVLAVFEGVGRSFSRAVELEQVVRDMLRVQAVTKQIDTKTARGCHDRAHREWFLRTKIIERTPRQIEMESSNCRT